MIFFILITFILTGIISITMILTEKEKFTFSLNLMHWLFILIFFSFTPCMQFINNNFPLYLNAESHSYILAANLFILTWIGFYSLGHYIRKIREGRVLDFPRRLKLNKRGVSISIILSIIILFLFLRIFGLKNLMVRGAYRATLGSIRPHLLTIFLDKFLRVIPVIALVSMILIRKKWDNKKLWWIEFGGLIVLNLFINNPLSTPRYWGGTIILAFIALLFQFKNWNKRWFILTVLVGILIFFPLASSLRRIRTPENYEFEGFYTSYTSLNYDAYEMTVHAIRYTKKFGITKGRQLLGPLLFWIPRNAWKNKPVGSGWFISRKLKFPHENLSCPLPAEGWINFGFLGLIIFASGFGWLTAFLDKLYWNTCMNNQPSFLSLIYPFLLGFFFLIIRGDLISGFSYTVMFIIASLITTIK